VTGVKVGDLVSGEGHLVCGTCRNCKAGRRHLCANTRGLGVHVDGAFAEYAVLPETNAWVHRNPVDLDVAAIFDPFGNAVHTALSFPVLGEDVLITGAGPIGIMAAAVAKHAGARNVVITDVSEHRLELARKVGVDLALNVASATIADAQAELGMSEGFDVGMEMSGKPVAMQDMIANMAHGGRIAMLGLPAEEFQVDWSSVVLKMLQIKGIYGREMYETWYSMSVLLQRGLDLTPVITHKFGYADHAQAFATAREGKCGKVVLDWTEA
jgi:threonine 3-dehydrogenase